jgi:F-type H+-transporting ATPase subunit beta
MSSGRIVQIIGAVIDVEFPRENVPKVYDALTVDGTETTLEVQQQLGDGVVRTIAMGSPLKVLKRGLGVTDTGEPILGAGGHQDPGPDHGRAGSPDRRSGPIGEEERHAIHREAPSYEDQASH